ncbi:MAG: NAD-dependent epimerase/dehydratase family protein [Dehalococcoidia bacterium]|nr:MAG: NAD-dependent epimerase/dehydratase family protein [Dehalococcoidia bacterium]
MLKKILITGGTALVGTAINSIRNDYPSREFIFIGSKDCDLTNKDETLEYVQKCKPDAMIHLAAISGGIGLSIKYPATVLRDNVLMNLHILEAARISKVKKIIMTLTSGMYPTDAPIPIKEEYIHEGYPDESNYGSSFAKRLIEPSIRAYRAEYRLNAIGLVPNGIFGENDNFNYGDAPMVPAQIRHFYENRYGNAKIIIQGDGSPLREYTYSKDVARAYMWCLDNYDDGQILNIGSTEEHSVIEIVSMIAEILNIDKKRIEFDMSQPKGVFRKSTDNSKFVQISNFKYTPFRVGLEKTIRWFCDTYEKSPESIRTYSKVRVA